MAIDPEDFIEFCQRSGISAWSGVPCSNFSGLFSELVDKENYFPAPNEGEAAVLASSFFFSGNLMALAIQSSGLLNALGPIMSWNIPSESPALIFVSERGYKGDEPQHTRLREGMGIILEGCEIPYGYLDDYYWKDQIVDAIEKISRDKVPYVFIVSPGLIDGSVPIKKYKGKFAKSKIIKKISRLNKKDFIVIGGTGHTSRELLLHESDNNIYFAGSMGSASLFGAGIAKNNPDKKIVVLDGDASALMRIQSMLTNASLELDNFCHIVLDDGINASTGGQPSLSNQVDFTILAKSLGYKKVGTLRRIKDLDNMINYFDFIHVKCYNDIDKKLPRPDESLGFYVKKALS